MLVGRLFQGVGQRIAVRVLAATIPMSTAHPPSGVRRAPSSRPLGSWLSTPSAGWQQMPASRWAGSARAALPGQHMKSASGGAPFTCQGQEVLPVPRKCPG
jgi:hypothetical protein